jgi:tetratricopeptide (TPR) repeat protein
MKSLLQSCLRLAVLLALPALALGQESPASSERMTADTNSAVIEGRVVLPSGRTIDRIVRITLRTSISTLYTTYSTPRGEFRFESLPQGIYYVEAIVEGENYEPATARVLLGRGIVSHQTLQLREKSAGGRRSPSGNIISTAELRQVVPQSARKEYELGLKQVGKGNFAQAAERFKQALAIYPDYLAARNDLGAQYLKLKRVDEAQTEFVTVLAKDPQNFNARFNLGLVWIERREFVNAISELNQAISLDSAQPAAHLWMGVALLETGDLAGAERELVKAIVMGGKECVAAHYQMARVYMMRGDPVEGSRSVKIYLEESPKGEYAKEAQELDKKLEEELKKRTKH